MRVVSKKKLREFREQHADSEDWLTTWYRTAEKAQWKSLSDIRQAYSSTDVVDQWVVFNVKGNRHRLITAIHFNTETIYIRHVLTHADDTRGDWKKR